MRKLIAILLIAGLVFAAVTPAHAILNRFNQDQKIKVAIFSNETTAAGQQTFKRYVSSTSAGILVPGSHRILGYMITPALNNSGAYGYELWMAMYDSTSVEQTNAIKLEAEVETSTSMGYSFWYPYPYEIKEGVVIYLGPNATVTIFYEDYRR
jgi:hypothetical protein